MSSIKDLAHNYWNQKVLPSEIYIIPVLEYIREHSEEFLNNDFKTEENISPNCPDCNIHLRCLTSGELTYDGDMCSIPWEGICLKCKKKYLWYENYQLISIDWAEENSIINED